MITIGIDKKTSRQAAALDNEFNVIAGFDLVGQTITFNPAWEATINGVRCSNIAEVVIEIPFADEGTERIDIVVFNTNGTFVHIPGTAAAPTIPSNALLATFFKVTDGSISTPEAVESQKNMIEKLYSMIMQLSVDLNALIASRAITMIGNEASNGVFLTSKAIYDWTVGRYQNILVSGTNIKTINGNSILGAGNLNVAPVVPFVTPEDYGAIGNDIADDSVPLQNAINSGKPVYLSNKTYKTTATLTVIDNVQIIGTGKASNIHLTTTNIPVITVNGKQNSFLNFTISGSSSGTLQAGLWVDGGVTFNLNRIYNRASGMYFENLGGGGIMIKNSLGSNLTVNHEGSFTASDCIFNNCTYGIYTYPRGEYNVFTNCKINSCVTGVSFTGGNNSFIGGSITECSTGINTLNGTNDSHSQVVGAMINHNTVNVKCSHSRTYNFTACALYAGGIQITGTGKTQFNNCQFSMNTFTFIITNSPVQLNDCEWDALPTTYTLTGTAPIMVNNYFGALKLAAPNVTYSELTTITANATYVIPIGHFIEAVTFENTTANAVTGGIKIGTTNGGTEVVLAKAVGANELVTVSDSELLKKIFSTTAGTTLYIQAVTAWNSASVKMYFKLRPLL